MKKWIFTIMTSLLLCACTGKSMNIEDARKAVLKDAGVNQNGVSFTREETINGEHIFEFSDQNRKYSYKVKDGNITSRIYTSIKDNINENDEDMNSTDKNNDNLNSTNRDNENNNSSNKNNLNNAGTITKDEAIDIALKECHYTRSQVSNIDVEDEEEDGTIVYKVEFYKDNQEYNVYINKQTGQVVNKHVEKDNRKVV